MSRIGRTRSITLAGLRGTVVEVEADIAQSLPGFTLLGLPDQSLQESRDRIRSAARNAGLPLTRRHLTVNLLPAGVQKRGAGHDLAIVLAAYAAEGKVSGVHGPVFLAELGLDGSLHGPSDMVAMAMAAVDAGLPDMVVAADAVDQAALVPGARVRGFAHLHHVVHAFGGKPDPVPGVRPEALMVRPGEAAGSSCRPDGGRRTSGAPLAAPEGVPDLSEVVGQWEARYALEVAAAGGHHLLLSGRPGAGKTMLAERLPGILPELDDRTALEAAALASLRSDGPAPTRLDTRPSFQAPHHSASMPALVGGGSGLARPGAASLAHGGVLFLDEAPEFDRRSLEALRQPLEAGEVVLHRAHGTVRYPARFQLVLAANPCPCGYGAGSGAQCRCTVLQRRRYADRLSGPLLDRVDVQVTVAPVTGAELGSPAGAEASAAVAARVRAAVGAQRERWGEANGRISGALLRRGRFAVPPAARAAADAAVDAGWLSARGHARVLRLAWTVADLRGATVPAAEDVDVALHLRRRHDEEAAA
ncbi:Mg chelatase-like protein [Micrococcus sp. HMSC067E09]|uniref:YifB family Mg chelatase-like AAA ATPase n=1 Tax=Micrococcus sp. HMSC067E09 TaxID=1739367 RepID=UPI0008A4C31D|nr:ATP-binding protein [Micrococcus sp. HMSC067E09]OFR89209.1 Mg chelatase-like protein [Micrococcus sp. HMSC067E09]